MTIKTHKSKIYKPKKLSGVRRFGKKREFRTNAMDYKKLYSDRSWVSYCYRFLFHNPRCYACGAKACEVDHRVPHKGDLQLFWDEKNYLALCKSCHSYVTSKFDRVNPPLVLEKHEWLVRTRLSRGLTHKCVIVPLEKPKEQYHEQE